ncbi:alpha-galactosidase, partial [Candidatus Poribacteria bacterium]|nr:alpha-galactosidase [Candidatus Poribacteria bacterium]
MTASDWLVTRVHDPVTVRQSTKSNGAARELVLSNGLVRRAFRLDPNAATVELSRLGTDTSVLRGVKPEAVAEIDGVTVEIGGLKGQPDYAYLDPAGLSELTADPDAFQFVGYAVSEPEAPYEWRPANHSADAPFPAEGKRLTLEFAAPDSLATGLRALVHYEMYVGLPALAKWLTFRNDGEAAVRIDGLVTELLAVTEDEKPRVHVESEFAFAGMDTTA